MANEISITARHSNADIVRAWKLGASYFLEKPFELSELFSVLKRVVPAEGAMDVMTREVIAASPRMKVSELTNLLVERHISGVPVVDQGGRLIGIVTEADILTREPKQDTVGAI